MDIACDGAIGQQEQGAAKGEGRPVGYEQQEDQATENAAADQQKGTPPPPALIDQRGIVQADGEPDVGDADGRQPDQVPQEIRAEKLLPILIERLEDEQGVNVEKEGGERETNDAHTRHPAPSVAVEPDGQGKPEKRDQVKDGKRHRNGLENMLRREERLWRHLTPRGKAAPIRRADPAPAPPRFRPI